MRVSLTVYSVDLLFQDQKCKQSHVLVPKTWITVEMTVTGCRSSSVLLGIVLNKGNHINKVLKTRWEVFSFSSLFSCCPDYWPSVVVVDVKGEALCIRGTNSVSSQLDCYCDVWHYRSFNTTEGWPGQIWVPFYVTTSTVHKKGEQIL